LPELSFRSHNRRSTQCDAEVHGRYGRVVKRSDHPSPAIHYRRRFHTPTSGHVGLPPIREARRLGPGASRLGRW
jgi:hypothetical protein